MPRIGKKKFGKQIEKSSHGSRTVNQLLMKESGTSFSYSSSSAIMNNFNLEIQKWKSSNFFLQNFDAICLLSQW